MNYSLVPIDASGGPVISLVRPVLLVGRHPECDIRLHSAKISRRHCCIALAYDRVIIRDLGSRNGLRVNGRLVEESRIHPRDEVAIGPLIYRFVAETQAENPGQGAGLRPAPAPGAGRDRPLDDRSPPGADRPDDPDEIGLVPIDSF